MSGLGEFLGERLKEQRSRGETQGLEPGSITSYFVFGDYKFKVRVTKILVEQQNLGGNSLIWGNSSFGTWGSFNWSSGASAGIYGNINSVYGTSLYSIGTGFILGNPTFGILGTSQLGGEISAYATTEEIILTQTIPTIARNHVAKWLASEGSTSPTYIALGTGSTAYSETDTNLEAEIAYKTISLDIGTDQRVEYQVEILSTDTSFHSDNFREVGLRNAETSGTLFTRGIISSLSMDESSNTRITVTHDLNDVTVGNAFITDQGLNEVRDWLGGSIATAPSHTGWGTGSVTITASDTAILGELERNAFTTTGRLNDQVSFEAILTKDQANDNDIKISGLWNADTGGTLMAESQFGAISKSSLFQIFETDRIKVL